MQTFYRFIVALLLVVSCAAQGFILTPPPSQALLGVYPDVPTPEMSSQITILDRYGGTLIDLLARTTNVVWKLEGYTITVTAELADPQGTAQSPIVVPLPSLPPGRYTVVYDGSVHLPNPERHRATMRFSVADTGSVSVVEYYNAGLDHYFITANAAEMAKLDAGLIAGWVRTGESFQVLDPQAAPTGAPPVCRMYGLPQAGLDTHFFSSTPYECDRVLQRWPDRWILETTAAFSGPVLFGALNTTNTTCGDAAQPLYRLYNNRADANHRYTVSRATRDRMIAQGWVLEGPIWDFHPVVPGDVRQFEMCVLR